jgi:DNA-binding transcriptional MerR regulator
MTMADRAHLSIGEVLSLLQDEFSDITISKIRFLESQGLLDPERTPSGYRKFYEGDIERLRWILRQQREHFLPLKVIKDRLEEGGTSIPLDELPLGIPPIGDPPPESATARVPMSEPAGEPEPDAGSAGAPARRAEPARPAIFAGLPEQPRSPTPVPAPADIAPPAPAPAPEPPPRRPPPPRVEPSGSNPLDGGPTALSLTFEELGEASGLSPLELRELQRFGFLEGRTVGADTYYDGEALVVASAAAGFIGFGIEPRHLRMYKVAAEREAGFFEQVVMPLLKQRNPAARQQAADTLSEMARLGEVLHAALLRHALRDHTAGR